MAHHRCQVRTQPRLPRPAHRRNPCRLADSRGNATVLTACFIHPEQLCVLLRLVFLFSSPVPAKELRQDVSRLPRTGRTSRLVHLASSASTLAPSPRQVHRPQQRLRPSGTFPGSFWDRHGFQEELCRFPPRYPRPSPPHSPFHGHGRFLAPHHLQVQLQPLPETPGLQHGPRRRTRSLFSPTREGPWERSAGASRLPLLHLSA